MWEALARGGVALDDTVRVAGRVDTVGRHLVARCLPPTVRDARVWEVGQVERVLRRVLRRLGAELAHRCARALEALGTWVLAREGVSLAMDDFAALPGHAARVAEALGRVAAVQHEYDEGLITDGERYNRIVDLWSAAVEGERASAREHTPGDATLSTLTLRGPALAGLRGMLGLQALPSGEIIERPVLRYLGVGIRPHEVFLRWRGVRRGVMVEDRPPPAVGPLLADLTAVLGAVTVSDVDCGARDGLPLGPARTTRGEVVASVGTRAVGRVLADAVRARDGTLVAAAGALVTEDLGARLDAAHIPAVRVRDPQTCAAPTGPCARCLGLDPAEGTWAHPGDALGARVAFELARSLRSVHMRTFHIC